MSDKRVIAAIQGGLSLSSRPYAEVAEQLGLEEREVIDRIEQMQRQGAISRLGVVVRHRELGYQANAMVVWDLPDERVEEVGRRLGEQECVTLCYQRPRRLPDWPYNLFSMIHGKSRQRVIDRINEMAHFLGIETIPRSVLFSGRRFKQRGARYQ